MFDSWKLQEGPALPLRSQASLSVSRTGVLMAVKLNP